MIEAINNRDEAAAIKAITFHLETSRAVALDDDRWRAPLPVGKQASCPRRGHGIDCSRLVAHVAVVGRQQHHFGDARAHRKRRAE